MVCYDYILWLGFKSCTLHHSTIHVLEFVDEKYSNVLSSDDCLAYVLLHIGEFFIFLSLFFLEDTSEMTGNVSVKLRTKAWQQKRVFFLTPQVMSNDLSRGLFPANNVKLLVVDEAHR